MEIINGGETQSFDIGNPVLDRLADNIVKFEITEQCDQFFSAKLTREEFGRFIEELKKIHQSM